MDHLGNSFGGPLQYETADMKTKFFHLRILFQPVARPRNMINRRKFPIRICAIWALKSHDFCIKGGWENQPYSRGLFLPITHLRNI